MSCRGGVGHVGVGWGGSCRGGGVMQGWGGVCHVGWQGGSYRGGVGDSWVNGENNRCYSYLSLDSE